jgi:hypothetical protein
MPWKELGKRRRIRGSRNAALGSFVSSPLSHHPDQRLCISSPLVSGPGQSYACDAGCEYACYAHAGC